jgi:hypothetical protein
MFEIRKAGKTFRIYDRERERYVAHTRNENLANSMVTDKLKNAGFEGSIPDFMLRDLKYGLNLDNKVTSGILSH